MKVNIRNIIIVIIVLFTITISYSNSNLNITESFLIDNGFIRSEDGNVFSKNMILSELLNLLNINSSELILTYGGYKAEGVYTICDFEYKLSDMWFMIIDNVKARIMDNKFSFDNNCSVNVTIVKTNSELPTLKNDTNEVHH